MTALLIGASTFGGMVLGWFGGNAFHRIEIWGRNMNERDQIFREMAQDESREVFGESRRLRTGIALVTSLGTPHPSA